MSEPRRSTADSPPRICVFAPDPVLTITLEDLPDGSSELHVHAGGQGFWMARMARILGARVSLCGAFGGETGSVLHDLIARAGLDVHSLRTRGPNGAYIHDRRGADGDRRTIADIEPTALSRHEADDLFGVALGAAMSADVMVLGGTRRGGVVHPDVFPRLTSDLSGLGIPVVADLSGDTMTAAASAGPTVLKVSHEDLLGSGHVDSAAESPGGHVHRCARERIRKHGCRPATTRLCDRDGPPGTGRGAGRRRRRALAAMNAWDGRCWYVDFLRVFDTPGGGAPPSRVRWAMRIVLLVAVVWLVIGAAAAFQRGYFDRAPGDCAGAGTTAVTVVAGPLNYFGVNPKVTNCELPHPST